jgi:hypothetical protein
MANSRLELRTISANELLEYAVVITQPITPDREFLGGRRIQIAGGETSKATITQPGVAFLIDEVLEILQII